MIKTLKQLWYYAKLIWTNKPIRSWRKLENGKYMCDGDCGRWSMHGVCTCGLCHFFKITEDPRDSIERDNISWRREAQASNIMRDVPCETKCIHDISFNDQCDACDKETETMLEQLIKTFKSL